MSSPKSPEGPQFKLDAVLGKSGGGADPLIPGTGMNTVAIDKPCHIETFDYNSKDPAATIEKHVARERNRGY